MWTRLSTQPLRKEKFFDALREFHKEYRLDAIKLEDFFQFSQTCQGVMLRFTEDEIEPWVENLKPASFWLKGGYLHRVS